MLAFGTPKSLSIPVTPEDTLRELLGEILTPEREQALKAHGRTEGSYEAAGLGGFHVKLTARPGGFDVVFVRESRRAAPVAAGTPTPAVAFRPRAGARACAACRCPRPRPLRRPPRPPAPTPDEAPTAHAPPSAGGRLRAARQRSAPDRRPAAARARRRRAPPPRTTSRSSCAATVPAGARAGLLGRRGDRRARHRPRAPARLSHLRGAGRVGAPAAGGRSVARVAAPAGAARGPGRDPARPRARVRGDRLGQVDDARRARAGGAAPAVDRPDDARGPHRARARRRRRRRSCAGARSGATRATSRRAFATRCARIPTCSCSARCAIRRPSAWR